ncbi:hypothetical protein [Okeania sp. SIO1F9]|uniref:hypothetical protein n=1 Tax=Okeania sp. SIO1F9 TaxID=2607813 RepID=UPI00257F299C|nr:hypothetical protein [Okeania sp. SIO1F9]
MPIELPNLDDRTYDDLVQEALSMIPTYAPEWTNHNPSDPGITLIELFAYLTEMLLYRQNRVTEKNMLKFVKLLNGPNWVQRQDLHEEVRLGILGIREQERAVTCEDFELLSTKNFNSWLAQMQQKERDGDGDLLPKDDEWWSVTGLNPEQDNLPSKVNLIGRAYCIPRRYLEAGSEEARRQSQPGHVSVIILPSKGSIATEELGPQPTSVQQQALWGYLDQKRLLTTRHHVVGPFYTPVSAEILVARYTDVPTETLRGRILKALRNFFNLFSDEQNNRDGWPFGRDVYVSEIYQLLEKIEGVDYLPDIMLSSNCQPQDQHCVVAETMWHQEGNIIGLRLYDHHLPSVRIEPVSIVIAPNVQFMTLRLKVSVVGSSDAEPKILKRLIKQKLRDFFHPLHGGPGLTTTEDTTITLQDLREVVTDVEGVEQIHILQSNPTQLLENGLIVRAGELIDLRSSVEVSG